MLVRRGAPRFAQRHLRRLTRDAERLGLAPASCEAGRQALMELARAAFPDGDGIVRLELRSSGTSAHLLGTARPLGDDPTTLDAVVSSRLHPGPRHAPGAKLTDRRVLDLGLEEARRLGAQEAILLDSRGRVVEGARTNLVVVDAEGWLRTPPVARGAVAGIALEIVRESAPDVEEADLDRSDLAAAREIVAMNAVRGARPVVRLDGRPVGSGEPGPVAARLDRILAGAG